jgi:hypothetical protein
MIRQLLYTSVAAPDFRPEMLTNILDAAHRYNGRDGITGLLCYLQGGFLQVLEGPPQAVEVTFEKVARDSRHMAVTRLLDREVAARAFPGWRMGFRELALKDGRAFELGREALREAVPPAAGEELLALFIRFYEVHAGADGAAPAP